MVYTGIDVISSEQDTTENTRPKRSIDPMQKRLPLHSPFVRIQNGLTNLVRDNKFFTIFVSKRG